MLSYLACFFIFSEIFLHRTEAQICNSGTTSGFCLPFETLNICPITNGYTLSRANCQGNTICCAPTQQTQQPTQPQCGIKGTDPRAVATTATTSSYEYCWQAQVFQKSTNKFLGGGSIIKNNVVVTSASILKSTPDNDLYVLVGDINQQAAPNNPCVQYLTVGTVSKHPQFNLQGIFENNVAVLKLPVAATLNGKCVCTICLPEPNQSFDQQSCTVTGLGAPNENSPVNPQTGPVYSAKLKATQVPVINQAQCQLLITNYANRNYRLHPNQLCAGSIEGQDACKGDGGGPLSCIRGQNVFVLAGIVSAGFGCYRSAIPGIYTKVANVLDFIKANS